MTLKAGFCEPKSGDFDVKNRHKNKRMLKKHGTNAVIFNIRYKLIFQNKKYFCPEFLPISCCVLTISDAIRIISDLRKNRSDMLLLLSDKQFDNP